MTDTRTYPPHFTLGLAGCPVMGVFRGLPPVETVRLATAAWDIGVTQVEVPIESTAALPSLRRLVEAGRERGMLVGAGTIVSRDQLQAASDCGAAYVVSPGLDPELIARADEIDMPFLPGIATPSEILRAQNLGFVWLKAFPATALGKDWFAAMAGPFPGVRLVATGGITGLNAREYLHAGASVVGLGAAFADPEELERLATVIVQSDNT